MANSVPARVNEPIPTMLTPYLHYEVFIVRHTQLGGYYLLQVAAISTFPAGFIFPEAAPGPVFSLAPPQLGAEIE